MMSASHSGLPLTSVVSRDHLCGEGASGTVASACGAGGGGGGDGDGDGGGGDGDGGRADADAAARACCGRCHTAGRGVVVSVVACAGGTAGPGTSTGATGGGAAGAGVAREGAAGAEPLSSKSSISWVFMLRSHAAACPIRQLTESATTPKRA
jgi:hypothetical protein